MGFFKVLGIAFALALTTDGCASVATGSPSPQASVPTRPPLWKFWLPSGWDVLDATTARGAIVLEGNTGALALDATSGRALWSDTTGASGLTTDGVLLYYGSGTGTIVAKRAIDGTSIWQRRNVCQEPRFGPVVTIVRTGPDLIVGCSGGQVVRIDARSGHVLAVGGAFDVHQISSIVHIGSCALAIEGWEDGAALRNETEIVGCKRLQPILSEQTDTTILGSIENVAIVDDWCCFGRPDVYRPATIYRVDLTTGATTPEVDLAPEPNRYPPHMRPLGQGSEAILEGGALYLRVDHALYAYGNPFALASSPQRIADNVVTMRMPLPGGLVWMRVKTADGSITDESARLSASGIAVVSSHIEPAKGASYILDDVSDVIGTGIGYPIGTDQDNHYFRIVDGAQVDFPGRCRAIGSSRQILITRCDTKILVGNLDREYIATYRWTHDATTYRK